MENNFTKELESAKELFENLKETLSIIAQTKIDAIVSMQENMDSIIQNASFLDMESMVTQEIEQFRDKIDKDKEKHEEVIDKINAIVEPYKNKEYF